MKQGLIFDLEIFFCTKVISSCMLNKKIVEDVCPFDFLCLSSEKLSSVSINAKKIPASEVAYNSGISCIIVFKHSLTILKIVCLCKNRLILKCYNPIIDSFCRFCIIWSLKSFLDLSYKSIQLVPFTRHVQFHVL